MEVVRPFPLEDLPPEVKLAILVQLPGRDLDSIKKVSRAWRELVQMAYLRHGVEAKDKAVVMQRWWRTKRNDALAYELRRRADLIESAIHVVQRVVSPKKTCLALRLALLSLIDEDGSKSDSAPAKKSMFFGLLSAFRSRGHSKPANYFTREVVETILPVQLLTDLCAPFERFLVDAQALLCDWEVNELPLFVHDKNKEAKTKTKKEKENEREEKPAVANDGKQEQEEKEEEEEEDEKEEGRQQPRQGPRQLFAPLLIRLLEDSLPPVQAYLVYQETNQLKERFIVPLCQVHQSPTAWCA
jgi:hypothetical protein